jgi:hypothetical protein
MIMTRLARACVFALALGSAIPALAVPLTDLRAEDLVPMAGDVGKMLNLNANQQTLWNGVETKSKAILRERLHRREALQDRAKALLAKPYAELRDLDKDVVAESAATLAENAQLRALWLEVNDALDDNQRRQVAGMLGEQLMRVSSEGRPAAAEHGGAGDQRGRGKGRGGRGGMGGGMNMPGGSLNIGG